MAFTEREAERLTGVSQRQLRAWAGDFYKPSIKTDEIGLPDLRLYSFRDLLCLKIINALRNETKLPKDELDAVKDRLSQLDDEMWNTMTLYVAGKRVLFDSGMDETPPRERGVLQIPLRVVASQMNAAVNATGSRDEKQRGSIEQRRDVLQNQPVIAGTRIPVRSIQAFANAGYSVEEINRQYPTLTKDDILAAVQYKSVA